MDDLLSVTYYSEIGVMGHDNNLTILLGMLDRGNKHRRDRLVIEILFWLVDDERDVTPVDEQIEHKKKVATFTRGKLVEGLTLPAQFESGLKIAETVDEIVDIYRRPSLPQLVPQTNWLIVRLSLVAFEVNLDRIHEGLDSIYSRKVTTTEDFANSLVSLLLSLKAPLSSLMNHL